MKTPQTSYQSIKQGSKQAQFVLKVLLISAGLSFLIKYIGSSLSIPVSSTAALITVFLPSLIMGILLWWRSQQ